MRLSVFVIVCFILSFMLFSDPVYAYLDPASGSIVWQVVVGGLLAALATVRIYWKKIKSFFTRSRKNLDRPG